jgi:hypothetical protein
LHRNAELLAEFPAPAQVPLNHVWLQPAVGIYANWLSYLARVRSPNLNRANLDNNSNAVGSPA